MPSPGLLGMIQGATSPEMAREEHRARLVDTLTRQREQDIEWKRMQTEAIEKAVNAGSMTWQEGLDRIAETWNDHKPNKQFLQEHAENVHGIHSLFDKVKDVLLPPPPNPNPLGTGTYRPPPSAKPRVPAATPPIVSPGPMSAVQTKSPLLPAPPGMRSDAFGLGQFGLSGSGNKVRVKGADGVFDIQPEHLDMYKNAGYSVIE